MSDPDKDKRNPLNNLGEALSGLDLGPKWAQEPEKGESDLYKKYERSAERESRGNNRQGGRRRPDGRQQRGAPRGDRPQRRDDGGGRFQGRRDGGRDRRPPRPEVEVPEHVKAEVMALESGVDGLAKEIAASGRTYSVFDLARFVLQSRDRYRVIFKSSDPEQPLIFCRKDQSLWLTRFEALEHVKQADWLLDYYRKEEVEADPPKGNFQQINKCGFSGELLGPPNFHTYQARVSEVHRAKFSNMSLQRYKSRIETVRGEEAVAAWLESVKTKTVYTPKTTEEIAAEQKAAEDAKKAEEDVKLTSTQTSKECESIESKKSDQTNTSTGAATQSEPNQTPGIIDSPAEKPADLGQETLPVEEEQKQEEQQEEATAEPVKLADLNAVAAHFSEHHFGTLFSTQERSWVPGNIQAKFLSPGLLEILKSVVSDERRYPGALSAFLCRQFTGRRLAVFKFKGKLKCGPARPKSLPADLSLSERPAKIIDWLKENSGKPLAQLWELYLPEGSDDETKKAWYGDLKWLINQGYVLLQNEDSTLHKAK